MKEETAFETKEQEIASHVKGRLGELLNYETQPKRPIINFFLEMIKFGIENLFGKIGRAHV